MVEQCTGLRVATERLTVRRFESSDLELALEHESDRRIMQYIRDPKPPDELRKKVEDFVAPWKGGSDWLGLPVTLRDRQPMIGLVCFRVVSFENESAEIGFRFHHDYHGRGYAFEASRWLVDFLFDELDVRKLIALCTAENAPSYRLLEKLGMQREGCLRDYSKLGGRWCDELVYGLLAGERRGPKARSPSSNDA